MIPEAATKTSHSCHYKSKVGPLILHSFMLSFWLGWAFVSLTFSFGVLSLARLAAENADESIRGWAGSVKSFVSKDIHELLQKALFMGYNVLTYPEYAPIIKNSAILLPITPIFWLAWIIFILAKKDYLLAGNQWVRCLPIAILGAVQFLISVWGDYVRWAGIFLALCSGICYVIAAKTEFWKPYRAVPKSDEESTTSGLQITEEKF